MRQRLLELGDAVESDGSDRWRVATIDQQKRLDCLERKIPHLSVANSDEKDKDEIRAIKQEILKISRKFFVEMGEKLKYVRDRKLHRFESNTFGEWCEQELGLKRRYAYNLINAFEVFQNVRNCAQNLPLPVNECQVRPLAKLEPEEQVKVWVKAIDDNNGKIPTGRRIQQIVRDLQESNMELSRKVEVEQPSTESTYPKLEIDSRYGKINRYLIPIKDEQLKQKIEQYAQAIGAATIEGAIAKLMERVKDEQ